MDDRYLIVDMEFYNLPEMPGSCTFLNRYDKRWKDVTLMVTTYLHDHPLNEEEFSKLLERRDPKLVHKSIEQFYIYNSVLVHRDDIYKTSLDNQYSTGNYNNLSTETKIFKVEWKKVFTNLSKPPCKAEILHAKYKHMPDPITWIKNGYETDEINEYSEFMNRFNLQMFKGVDNYLMLCRLIKKLN